ncbi:MAG: prepilin-type N-terminal cleavage/methylation domain-containing protein [Planctomycetaceae bacterium]|nr:prepilin-type N-terminal cleavage/methylation domain-containing protein [Planctomycetaceae bacterium]
MTFQIIRENNISKFAVLPFGNLEALEDDVDELWAAKTGNTVAPRRGMTLMEVLASVFVICIGLMGVLAVIPFGAFQVSKAREAQFTSNMLVNAKNEIRLGEWAKPAKWREASSIKTMNSNDGTPVINVSGAVRCDRIYLVDPFDGDGKTAATGHIFPVGKNFDHRSLIQEALRGRDDLQFTIHNDKRTDFEGQRSKVQSSGKYTWFFTYRPTFTCSDPANHTHGNAAVPLDELNPVTVDLLGCYNRTPGEEGVATANYPADVVPYLNAAQITLTATTPEALDLTKTKWLFVSWEKTVPPLPAPLPNTEPLYDGGWYKVVNFTPIETGKCTVFLSGFPQTVPTTKPLQILNVPDVLYHTTVMNVPLN